MQVCKSPDSNSRIINSPAIFYENKLILHINLFAMHIITFIIAVFASSFGHFFYLYITSSKSFENFFSPGPNNNSNHIIFQRLTGALFFGIIPTLIITKICNFTLTDFGITSGISAESILWISLLTAFIIPLNYFNSKKPDNLAMYPQIRKEKWSIALLIASSLSWIMYLLAYEMLFRGFLLFSSLNIFGYWPAILINTIIYSLVHYHKGPKEIFGAIPLGFILCILTIKTGNFWIAFITHIFLALSNEWFSLREQMTRNLKKVNI